MDTRFAVVAFPECDAHEQIETIRRRYDPLSGVIDAHVTLVFPFGDAIDQSGLARHVAGALTGLQPFDITLETVSAERDGYVFLNIGAGAERLAAIHDRLYSGPLARHRSRTHDYRPHITVGQASSGATAAGMQAAIQRTLAFPLAARVRGLALFRLDGPAAGRVAWSIPLLGG